MDDKVGSEHRRNLLSHNLAALMVIMNSLDEPGHVGLIVDLDDRVVDTASAQGTDYAGSSIMLPNMPRWSTIVHWSLIVSTVAMLGGCATTKNARRPVEDESSSTELDGAAYRTSRQSVSGRKVAGGVLLVLGVPTMLISGGLVTAALAKPSEGAIPVLFLGPLVFLGATVGLVVPGIILVSSDERKQQQTSQIRPTLTVGPTGASMTLPF